MWFGCGLGVWVKVSRICWLMELTKQARSRYVFSRLGIVYKLMCATVQELIKCVCI